LSTKTVADEIHDLISLETAEITARLSTPKVNIDRLIDAVVKSDDGTLLFIPDVGEKVIIERYTMCLPGNPWLDTKVYTVRGINDETGDLYLWDEDSKQQAMSNYITGPQRGFTFKIPAKFGSKNVIVKRRTRRTKVERELEAAEKALKPKGRRGRPKGQKNRPKEEIALEKAARAKIQTERAEKRDERKRRAHALTNIKTRTLTPVGKDQTKKKSSRGNKTKKSKS
jgi:hypothetical protein